MDWINQTLLDNIENEIKNKLLSLKINQWIPNKMSIKQNI